MSGAGVLMGEVHQSWRGLLRRPGYLALAVLTLALGVATVTVVFSLLYQALLRPLPFPQPERLVSMGIEIEKGQTGAAPGYYESLKRMQTVESAGMLMSWAPNANIAIGERAEVVPALRADRGFLQTLGLPLAAGRNFDEDENRPNGPQAVILSYPFWRSHFDADPATIGRNLQVEGRSVQIVGVLPAAFQWPDRFDLLLSLQPDLADTDLSTNQIIIARLKPQVNLAAAAAETHNVLTALITNAPSATEEQREYLRRSPPTALPLQSSVFAQRTGDTLWMFLGAALCVLLIAAINLTSLMLLRALARSHDSAVRAALGAPLLRLSTPALAEGGLIGLSGAAAGLLLAWLGLRLFGTLVPPEWMRGEAVRLTAATPLFALFAGVLTALLAAALGVVRARRRDWARELAGGGRTGWSRQAGRLSRALVIAQVAVAVALLIGAALFARSLQKLEAVPMGFHSEHVTTFTLSPLKSRFIEAGETMAQTQRILERLQRMPNVEMAGASSNLPTASQLNIGIALPDKKAITTVQFRLSSPDFLTVFGVPLLAGRGFDERDSAGAELVCMVNATFARDYLGGDPLGKIMTLPLSLVKNGHDVPLRVVGVVGDVRQLGPAKPVPAILYTPMAQIPSPFWALIRDWGPISFALRLRSANLGADEGALRAALQEVAPQQPIANVQSMDAVVASTTSQQRLNLAVVGLFAALALLLAAVGLYAVMASAVAARRHEFGVRAALGASPSRLLRQVLRESGWQVGLGLAIGLAIAMAASQLLQSFLFEVSAADPAAIGAVLVVLALAGLIASLVPALRAARVEPMQALRVE